MLMSPPIIMLNATSALIVKKMIFAHLISRFLGFFKGAFFALVMLAPPFGILDYIINPKRSVIRSGIRTPLTRLDSALVHQHDENAQ